MGQSIWNSMQQKGYSRRDFLPVLRCGRNRGRIGSNRRAQVVSAFEKKEKPAVVWLHFQECTCCSESFIRASHPIVAGCAAGRAVAELHRDLMAASGFQAEKSLNDTIANNKGKYIVLVEGAVPTKDGRRLLHDRRQDRGVDSANRGQGCGGGRGLGQLRLQRLRAGGQAESDRRHADLQAGGQAGDQRARLPAHRRRDDGVVTHLLVLGQIPALDSQGRPKEFYGRRVHDTCYRRPTTTPGCSSSPGTTRTRARAIASTRWAAAARSPTTPAR
jgi:hydrogenase small subunit